MTYTLEPALLDNAVLCYEILKEGRDFQKEQGFEQWTDSYPDYATVLNDIQNKIGYVIKTPVDIAGYVCVDFSGEPAYADIEGQWQSEMPYAVVHRMAFSQKYRGTGLADTAFRLIEKLCIGHNVRYIRIDTDFPNMRMRHILKKNGFVNCGVISFQGGRKLAFDKLLP